jgi:hypothetical protein
MSYYELLWVTNGYHGVTRLVALIFDFGFWIGRKRRTMMDTDEALMREF